MATPAVIIDLRKALSERFPAPSAPAASVLTTGLRFLDRASGGGLPKSAITELITPRPSAGSASLLHALLRAAQQDRHFVALIDGSDSFDPGSSDNSALRHLLWVRCRKAFDAIKAADFLLRDGNFPLVIVDLVLNTPEELRKIPQTSWYRLQRLGSCADGMSHHQSTRDSRQRPIKNRSREFLDAAHFGKRKCDFASAISYSTLASQIRAPAFAMLRRGKR